MTEPAEEPLTGGNMAGAVVRVGDTVRRPATPQTPTIHRLLRHVRHAGVTWVPRVHGVDDKGREILDYVEGDVAHGRPDHMWTDANLVAVARALRAWHDATSSFPRSDDDAWWTDPVEPAEVICQWDFAEYNHVYRDGAFAGAIDFDLCCPGPRLWDLAYTAYRYVPLTPRPNEDVDDGLGADRSPVARADQLRRIDVFLAAYGEVDGSPLTAAELLPFAVRRLDALADWCAEREDPDLRRNGVMYRAHARWIEAGAFGAAT